MDNADDLLNIDLPEEKGHVQIQDISHMHDQIINWMIVNPGQKLRVCADHFGITQPWLSTLIHTDLFQARLKERQDRVFEYVAADIPQKLVGLSNLAIEKMGDMLEKTEDPDRIIDSFDKIMHRAGYAPAANKAPAGVTNNTQVNIFAADKNSLAEARARMQQRTLTESELRLVAEVTPSPLTIENDANTSPAPQ